MIRSRRLAALLMAVYLVVVAWIVFLPTADVASGSVHVIAGLLWAAGFPAWITPTAVEFVTNVLLFAPVGFLGRTFRPHWGWLRWLMVGLAGTLTIEAVQHLLLPERSAQLMDVVANSIGAVAGYGAAVVAERTSAELSRRDRAR